MDGNKLTLLQIMLTNEDYLSYESLAQQIQVSSRTIIRFMKDIQAYIKPYHIDIVLKKGRGIRLQGDAQDIDKLKEAINLEQAISYTGQERMIFIMIELFQSSEYTKLYYLSYALNVSLPTIHNDISAIEEYLSLNHLKLENQRGLGIKIIGYKKDIIWAIASFLLPYMDWTEQTISYIPYLHHSITKKMQDFFSLDIVKQVKLWIDEFDYTLTSVFVLEDYHHFIILNTIMISYATYYKSCQDGYFDDHVAQSDVHYRYHEFCKKVNQLMNKNVVHNEEGNLYVSAYLAMRKVGTQLDTYQYDEELYHLVLRFLADVEKELHLTLNKDNDLVDRLSVHMKLVIDRIRMGTVISNNYIDEVKKKYAHVFEIVKQHLYLIENRYAVHINENEIGYIAIHVLATMIEQENSTREMKAAILCMSGMGTSKMLMESIRQRYPLLSIGCSLSLEEFNEFALIQEGYHIIVSTIQLETITLPCVVVHPIMNEQDFYNLNVVYEKLIRQHHIQDYREGKRMKVLENDKGISQHKEELLLRIDAFKQVIEQFSLCDITCSSFDELLMEIANREIASEDRKLFQKKIHTREQLGSTLIDKLDFILIHCRLKEQFCLKLYRIKEGFLYYTEGSQQRIQYALVMIAPQQDQPYLLEMISQISMAVASDESFQKSICEEDENEILRSMIARLAKLL